MNHKKMWRYLILGHFILQACEVQSARILGVFPIPSRSHQVVFRSYTQELARLGHELVIITPDPIPKDKQAYNVTDIDVSFSYASAMEEFKGRSAHLKRGVIKNIDAILDLDMNRSFLNIVVEQFQHPSVQKLLNDKTQKFDLIVVEGFFEYQFIVTEFFKAPVISFSSFMGFPEHFDAVGAYPRHPILYPHLQRMNFGKMSFWPMLKEIIYELRTYWKSLCLDQYQDEYLKKNFGPQAPTTSQLRDRIDLMFLNSYTIFSNNRPAPPNVIYIGATHLEPVKDVPKDLMDYLDNSKRGVIYVSFGSNILPSMMHKDLLDSLLQAFEALPYDVLWRFDGDSIENVPKNVKWQKWFPQRDLLYHPNIKAFVTQCGLQSTDEAIDAEVPLVGVPMMAEQWYNAQKYADFGIGVKLDSLTLTADDLVKGVATVAGNQSYKENIKKIKAILNDSPQTPIERAIWWTEYVLRHGGAKHLRAPGANISWSDYYMLDFVIPLIALAILTLISIYSIIRFVLYNIFQKRPKVKNS